MSTPIYIPKDTSTTSTGGVSVGYLQSRYPTKLDVSAQVALATQDLLQAPAGAAKLNSLESIGSTLDIASASNTQTVNIGSGTAVQTVNLGNSGSGATAINIGGTNDQVNIAGMMNTTLRMNSVKFEGANLRKRIALYEVNGFGMLNDHRFFGFGVAPDGSLLYQINWNNLAHSFCAATGANGSTEVFRINGTGDTMCLGTFTAGNLNTAGVLTAGSVTTGNLSATSLTLAGVSQQLKLYPSVNAAETSLVFNSQTNGTGTAWIAGQGAYAVGAGNFGIGNSVNALAMKIDTTNVVQVQRILSFPSANNRKLLAIYDGGDLTSSTDHRFCGLGMSPAVLNYQALNTTVDHVFYAATGPAASNELLRIKGTGAVSCGGNLTAGSLTTAGALTAGSIEFPTGTLTYEIFDHTTTFTNGSLTTTGMNIRITRTGRLVSLMCRGQYLPTGTALSGIYTSNTSLPSRFWPTVADSAATTCRIMNNGVNGWGYAVISSTGVITISADAAGGSFNGSGQCGWYTWSTSWQLF